MNTAALSLFLAVLVCAAASADELVLPPVLERDQSVEVEYRFDAPATGAGFLDIEWSDAVGRIVDRNRILLDLRDGSEATFTLDIRRAVTTKNHIAAHLSFDFFDQSGRPIHRDNDEAKTFIATPTDSGWSDYQIIVWQGQTSAAYATLKELGVTAGMLEINHREIPAIYTPSSLASLVDADLRCYLENITTDFYSPYHKWYDGREVNWRFLEAKRRYWANPLDRTAFTREPSLSDAEWLKNIQHRLARSVRALHVYRPLYYSLGDETGIGDLSAFWDFDLSDPSLTAMREWLKDGYGSLAALNTQWGTAFSRWDEVVPMTTDEAMKRSDQNFSAWADFKEWMDIAFARAVKSGTDAVHTADPAAISAIEGAQIPGWGGYDYSRLAASVDAMELYDYGENVAIARSINPELIMLTTSFNSGPAEAHRVWRELLRGTRGLVLWDEKHGFAAEDGSLGDRGRQAASYFGEIRGGLGALLINSRRYTDPIGILYSPASRRVQWLLDRRMTGEEWSHRNASAESQDDVVKTGTRNFASALQHMGLQHRFISSEEVRHGALREGNYRALILPHTIALARSEAEEIRDFVAQGGVIIADSQPGLFDDHGRRLARPLLSEVFPGPPTRSAISFAFGQGRAIYLASANGGQRKNTLRLSRILEASGVKPLFPVLRTGGRPTDNVETYIFTNGALTIVALQRDYISSPALRGGESFVMELPRVFSVYDVRAQQARGITDRVEFELGPVEPLLLTLSEQPVAPPSIDGPRSAHRGEIVEFQLASRSLATRAVFHLDVLDPENAAVAHYSGNMVGRGATTGKLIPLALNDRTGIWKLRITDLLSGQIATTELDVEP